MNLSTESSRSHQKSQVPSPCTLDSNTPHPAVLSTLGTRTMADVVHPLINADNQGPAIVVAAAFCMSISILIWFARLWIRIPLSSLFSYDDWLASAATTFGIANSILTMDAVRNGLGRRLGSQTTESLGVLRLVCAASIVYLLCLSFGKLAVALLMRRLCATKGHQRAVSGLIIGIVLWGIGSVLAIAIPFDPRDIKVWKD